MPWAKIDDGLIGSRKVRKLSAEAWRMYVSAIVWSCRERSDGVIDGEDLRELLPRREYHEDHVRSLLAAGLLHDNASGDCESETCLRSQGLPMAADLYVIHDFHQWQMTTDEWEARESASAKANHTKWHVKREIRKEGCRYCYPPPTP